MIDADFIEKIEKLVRQASPVVHIPGDPHAFYEFRPGDGLTRHELPPAPAHIRAQTLHDFVEAVRAFCFKGSFVTINATRAFAWIDEKKTSRVEMPLNETPYMKHVATALSRPLKQDELHTFLARTMRDRVSPPDAAQFVRRVAFGKSSTFVAEVGGPSDSLGRTQKAELQSEPMPASVVLSVPPFMEADYHTDVLAFLYVNPTDETFSLVPPLTWYRDAILGALGRMQAHIAEETKLPTYIGSVES